MQREAALRAELEVSQAKVRDLQRGAPGRGRTLQSHLPARSEFVEMAAPRCPNCGVALGAFPGTEDSEVLEIEVQAYRRVIHRRRYRPTCDCGCVPGIVTAPPPPRLIERGKFGLSVWTSLLLDKFLYARPSHRLMHDLADHGPCALARAPTRKGSTPHEHLLRPRLQPG